jgi:hypothetical protein
LRGFVIAVALSATLWVPSAASALTYTVDPSHAPDCDTNHICGSISKANASVRSGDVVDIKANPKPYVEPPILVTATNVTFQAASPGQVTITGDGSYILADPANPLTSEQIFDVFVIGNQSMTSGDNGDGTILRGLKIEVQPQGGRAVFARAADITVDNCILTRQAFTDVDVPVYDVEDTLVDGEGFTLGTQTIKNSIVLQYPRANQGLEAPAIWSGNGSTLAITDSFVASGQDAGAGIKLAGNDFTTGVDGQELAVPNRITRSVVIVKGQVSNGIEIESAWDSDLIKQVDIDSSLISAGPNGTGIQAISNDPPAGTTSQNVGPLGLPAFSASGDIHINIKHGTIAGAERGIVIDARAHGGISILSGAGDAIGPGSIYVDADRSIIHGANLVFHQGGGGIPLIGTQVGNEANLRLIDSDTPTSPSDDGAGGSVEILGEKTDNSDEALFFDTKGRDYHLRPNAPVIDKGGKAVNGESETDIDGNPRQLGPATDRGADEFTNRPPTAVLTADTTTPRQNQVVTFSALQSKDPEAAVGGGLVAYQWIFGDGSAPQTTTTPTVGHRYAKLGTFNATLIVLDSQGGGSQPAAPLQIVVHDGVAPVVSIVTPKAGERLRVGGPVKKKTTTKVVPKTNTKVVPKTPTVKATAAAAQSKNSVLIRFSGKASDDNSGLARVELSLRRISAGRSVRAAALKPKKKKLMQCTIFDGKSKFLRKACKNATFFRASYLKAGVWAWRMKTGTFLRTGTYVLSARGVDQAGNVGVPVTRRFSVR